MRTCDLPHYRYQIIQIIGKIFENETKFPDLFFETKWGKYSVSKKSGIGFADVFDRSLQFTPELTGSCSTE